MIYNSTVTHMFGIFYQKSNEISVLACLTSKLNMEISAPEDAVISTAYVMEVVDIT